MTTDAPASRHPLIVIANRLPVSRTESGWKASTGGLVTALRPAMSETGGAWVGWDGGESDVPARVDGLDIDLHPLSLSHAEVQGYYYGFANRTIWPLFHDLVEEPIIERRWWNAYRDVNRKFAETLGDLKVAGDRKPTIWIHDYHLMLLPELVRGIRPGSAVGFFLHIPFPPPELMARLPWRDEILRGLLGADLVGFHTERYRQNFVRSCERVFSDEVKVDGHTVVMPDGRRIRTAAHPISIDPAEFADFATSEETERELAELREQFAGRQVFLGVDRLDYTKGVRHRLQAIDELLGRNVDLRRKFAFVQIAVPSRDEVKEYQDLRVEVETEVGRINGRFTEPGGDVPVHYLYRGVSKTKLAAYYRLADVMAVTPLKDGMNLVAKEFVTCQDAGGEAGALLLSEFTGASLEFGGDAVRCNPFDVVGLSYLMEACLALDETERRARIERMAQRVRDFDVYRWADLELGAIEASGPAG